jgi:hypothetical protein
VQRARAELAGVEQLLPVAVAVLDVTQATRSRFDAYDFPSSSSRSLSDP